MVQEFVSNTNDLPSVIWVQVFLSNTYNLPSVIWVQVFLSNTKNLPSVIWFKYLYLIQMICPVLYGSSIPI